MNPKEAKVILSFISMLLFSAFVSTAHLKENFGNELYKDDFGQSQQLSDDLHLYPATECVLCIIVANDLENIAKKGNKDDLKKAIEHICQEFHQNDDGICNKMIHDHSMEIFDMIVNHDGAKKLCTSIKMCITEENKVIDKTYTDLMKPNSQVVEGPICTICKILVDQFLSLIDSDNKREFIVNTATSFCHLMPSFLKNPCSTFVHEIVAGALELFSRISSDQYCTLFCIFSNELKRYNINEIKIDF